MFVDTLINPKVKKLFVIIAETNDYVTRTKKKKIKHAYRAGRRPPLVEYVYTDKIRTWSRGSGKGARVGGRYIKSSRLNLETGAI